MFFCLAHQLQAQDSKRQSVLDLYLLLPETYFAKPDFDKWRNMTLGQYRESVIKIRDIQNGYLRVEEPVRDGWAEVATFKQSDGHNVVGVSEVDCGPGCDGKITFLQYVKGSELSWYNMTNTVLPEISKNRIRAAYRLHRLSGESVNVVYVLPRVGTTIKVQNAGDYFDIDFKPVVLFELNWDGTKFVLHSK
ncbi:MAG: hypothetical protein ACRD43_02800 [Pyrinomonadaceae bacterium]